MSAHSPSREQINQLILYLQNQARFHQWQYKTKSAYAVDKGMQYLRDASLCEGWAMALPDLKIVAHNETPTEAEIYNLTNALWLVYVHNELDAIAAAISGEGQKPIEGNDHPLLIQLAKDILSRYEEIK